MLKTRALESKANDTCLIYEVEGGIRSISKSFEGPDFLGDFNLKFDGDS